MLKKLVIATLILLPLPTTALIITEVQVAGESPNDCYIKIYNPSASSVDISSYNLRKKTASGNDSSVRVFPSGSIIKGEGYFTWASSRNAVFPETVNADVISTQYLASNNSIALLDRERNLIDAVAWGEGNNPYVKGTPLKNPEAEQLIVRINDNGYMTEGDNSSDFTLYPPAPSPLQITNYITDYGEKDDVDPLYIALTTSLLFALFITYISKKWPDTVTRKT